MWQHYKPEEPLSDFVDILWYYEGEAPAHARERLLPSGEMELVVNLHEDEIRTYGQRDLEVARRFRGAVVVGSHSEYFVIDNQQQERVIGAHFRPGGAFPFLPMPASELRDQHVALGDLWGEFASELRERVLAAPDLFSRFRIFEQCLLARATRPLYRNPAVTFALSEFRRARTVRDVTDELGMSARRFIQAFGDEVGLTPKLFCRVRRFQRLLRTVQGRNHVDWATLALDSGYFDQAHFIHDFRSFAGMTPSEYLSLNLRHSNHVPIG